MPRVGYSIEEQSSSSQFKIENGNGEVVAAQVVNDVSQFGTKCGIKVTVQRWSKDWKKQLDDEPVSEFLSAGPNSKFHPSNASSSDDADPEDLGEGVEAEGNCILSVEGAAPDKKSKLSLFGASLQEKGVKPALLNGYAPNLIGLKAHFFQEPQARGAQQAEGTRDPTALTVTEISQFPHAQTGGKATGTKATATAAAPKATPAAAGGKPNGAVKPVAAKPAPAASEEEEVNPQAIAETMRILSDIGKKNKAIVTLTKPKLGGKVVMYLTKVDQSLHAPIQKLIKDDEWLEGAAGALDPAWGFENGEVTIPAGV